MWEWVNGRMEWLGIPIIPYCLTALNGYSNTPSLSVGLSALIALVIILPRLIQKTLPGLPICHPANVPLQP